MHRLTLIFSKETSLRVCMTLESYKFIEKFASVPICVYQWFIKDFVKLNARTKKFLVVLKQSPFVWVLWILLILLIVSKVTAHKNPILNPAQRDFRAGVKGV